MESDGSDGSDKIRSRTEEMGSAPSLYPKATEPPTLQD